MAASVVLKDQNQNTRPPGSPATGKPATGTAEIGEPTVTRRRCC